MKFCNILIGKPYSPAPSFHVLRHRIYLFGEGETRVLPLKSMILPVSIGCSTCANHIAQGTTLTYVKRHGFSETSLGAPIVTFVFNCTKCRALIQMKEDPENSGYVVEDGATNFFDEHEKSEHRGKISDEDGLDHETSDSNLKVIMTCCFLCI
ncbi:splicing factor YJU2-like [Rosa chinensis]|uniref:splicing factor YJU2-like n=1 Tax=Rosa chinensis TaxID=74649 RepID=UPI001AD90570|nr:splicing factor YJU2-like [Rosa chinensis]